MKIIIVDDEKMAANALADKLKEKGYKILINRLSVEF